MSDVENQADHKDRPSLGLNVRRLRAQRGWNLNRLAAQSGLPQSTLSKVENGQMSLNYDKLLVIARALEVDVSELFASPNDIASRLKPMARRTIQRAEAQGAHVFEQYEYRYLCTELKNRLMVPILFTVRDGSNGAHESDDYQIGLTHVVGERFAFIISGEVDFISEQYETTRLYEGDALYIDAAMPHAFIAPDGKTAKVLAVVASDDHEYLAFVRHAAREGLPDATQAYERYLAGFDETRSAPA